jgi:hypothetical protein
MENSPPGIHTMPSGARPGGGVLFSIVTANADAIDGVLEGVVIPGFERIELKASAAPLMNAAAKAIRIQFLFDRVN